MGIQRDGVVGTGDPDRDAAVIAHFGDGASSQGDVNEAFIFAASYNAPVVFFCQNNQWAISEPIERQTRIPLYQRALGFGFPGVRVDGNDVLATYSVMQAALQRARDGQGPTFVEAYTYRMGAHTTTDDPTRYRLSDDVEHWKLKDPIARVEVYLKRNGLVDEAFFADVAAEADALGVTLREGSRRCPTRSPRHLRPRLRRADRRARRPARRLRRLPRVLRGGPRMSATTHEPPATPRSESPWPRPSTWACARRWRTTPRSCSWARTSASSAASSASPTACRRTSARTASSTPRWPSPGIVGTAVGLALRGYRPVVEIQFDGFVYPAYDQIVCQVAKMHFRSKGRSPMPMVIRIPFGGGIGAVEHHSESPEAQFAHTPGLKVVACSNPVDGYWMIQQAIACDDPVIFLEPKRQYHADKADLDDPAHAPTRCSPRASCAQGSDVTVLAYGPTVKTAMKAAEAAAEEGRSLEVVDLRTLSPLDMGPVLDSVRRTGRVVVTHEAHVNLGMGAELAARITEECFYSLEAPVLRVGGFDTPYPASRIEEEYLPDLDRVLDAVDRSMGF